MLDRTIDQHTAQAAANTGAVLYASAETRQQLGWVADRLPQWAGQDIILISREDIAAALPQDVLAAFPRMPDILAGRGAMPDELDERQSAAIKASLRTHFNNVGLPNRYLNPLPDDPVGRLTTHELLSGRASIATNSLVGNAAALTPQFDVLDEHSGLARPWNLCIVMMPDMAMSPNEIGGMLGALPADSISMPGTARDWQALILSHEADHCSTVARERTAGKTNLLENILALEIMADQTAMNMTRTEHARGNITSPDIARAFADVRAISAIMRSNVTHSTSPAIDPHGDHLVMQPRNDDIASIVFDTAKTPPDNQQTSLSMLEDFMARIEAQHPDTDTISSMDIFGLHHKIFDFLTKEAGMISTDSLMMGNFMREDPALLFETVRFLNARGDFESNPAQQRLADQFIAAADRIAPHIFETRIPGPFLVDDKPPASLPTPHNGVAGTPTLTETPRPAPLPGP